MLIKYTGLAPITNIYGDWYPGEVKNVEKDISGLMGFEKIERVVKPRIYDKPVKEKMNDKADKKNKYVKEGENK